MMLNLFVTSSNPLRTLKVRSFSIDSNIPPNEYYKIVKGTERKLFSKRLLSTTYNDKILCLENNLTSLDQFEISGYKFIKDKTDMVLNAAEHNLAICHLVEKALKQLALSKGYIRTDGQKYYKTQPYKESFFSYYDAFYAEAEVFHDGSIGLWLDPAIKWKYKLANLLNWAEKNNYNEIEDYLLGRKVKFPSVLTNRYYNAKIVKLENTSLHNYTIEKENNKTQSLYGYWNKSWRHRKWLENNNILLTPENSPVVLLEVPNVNKPLPYPASVLEIVIDLLDPIVPEYVFREKKSLTPIRRMAQTLALYDILLRDGLDLGSYNITFPRQLYKLNSSSNQIGRVISLLAPTLQFGNNGICAAKRQGQDPYIKNALFRYGPVDVKNSINISYVGPESEEKRLKNFNNYLNTYAKQMHLGNFQYQNFYGVDRISADRYMRICQNIRQEDNNQIIMVLLPRNRVTATYYSSKRGLGKHFIKSEMVQWKTFNDIIAQCSRGKTAYSLYNIALKAYGRALEPGESVWHLKAPAGGLNPKLNYYYMGFDVSRNPETRKEAAAYAAVCDSLGRVLYKNSISTHRGEKIVAEILSDWFFELVTTIYDEIGNEKKIDGLMLFKDGNIPYNQIEDYKRGALLAKERLLEEHVIHENSDIKVIAAIKRGLHRVYGDRQQGFQINYSGILRSPTEAILVTSKPKIGTASTTRLNLTYQIKNDMDIEQIARIFNDLRYLDWNSLFSQPKTILPLHIVQNLAKLSKEDVIVPYVPR